MISTKVNIYNKQKMIKIPTGTRLLIRKACIATLRFEEFEKQAYIDVSLVDDGQIKEMNAQFRNINKATDVLSFPLGENGVYDEDPETGLACLGDIVISVEHAFAQADLYGHSIQREFAFLTVHSMLHLLGYDHVAGGLEQRIMEEKQEAILEQLGLAVTK